MPHEGGILGHQVCPRCPLVKKRRDRASSASSRPRRTGLAGTWQRIHHGCIGRLSWRRVTEIPEHLLKRSRERRAALEGDSGGTAAAPEPTATTPATTQASAPVAPAPSAPTGRGQPLAPAAPPPPKPDSFPVAAYKKRNR